LGATGSGLAGSHNCELRPHTERAQQVRDYRGRTIARSSRSRNSHAGDRSARRILRKAFDDAKLSAEIEVYKGANHGWMPPDSQNHNAEAAEKGWARKLALFKKALA